MALWRGSAPTFWRVAPGAGLYFFILHSIQGQPPSLAQGTSHAHRLPAWYNLAASGIARATAACVLLPATVLKTRMESAWDFGAGRPRPRMLSLARAMWRNEGPLAFYQGLLPTLLRDVPFSSLYYALYVQAKQVPFPGLSPALHSFLCGTAAGGLASLITQPPDVVRTRLQLQRGDTASAVSGSRVWRVVCDVHRERGLRGFFRGVGPRLAKRALTAALTWTAFEELLRRGL